MLASLAGRLRGGGCWRGGMRWRWYTSLLQGAIKNGTKFADRQRSLHLLSVDKQGRSGAYTKRFSLPNGSLDHVLILRLDARLELGHVQIVFLPLQQCQAVKRCELAVAAFFRIYFSLVGVDVVGEFPVRIATLRSQAVGVRGGVRGPGVNFGEREVFIDENHAIAILLEQLRKQRLV